MKRRLVISALFAALVLLLVTVSQAEVIQNGNLRVKFNADFDPHVLPRQHPAPIKIEIQGGISTTDGSHPPPLQWLEIELNRHGKLSAAGLDVCSAAVLQSTTTAQAIARCGSSRVGEGRFHAEVALGGDVPAAGQIIAFNSRVHGKPALLLHFSASAPVRFTLVVPLTITRRSSGEFGTLLRTRVPRLASGLGSITQIDLTIGRRYSVGGERRTYVAAACGAPAETIITPFAFARARFRFQSHSQINSTLLKSCRVRKP